MKYSIASFQRLNFALGTLFPAFQRYDLDSTMTKGELLPRSKLCVFLILPTPISSGYFTVNTMP